MLKTSSNIWKHCSTPLSSFSLQKYGYLPTKSLILVTNEQQRHKCYCTNIHYLPITENNDNNIKNKITTSLITCKIVNKYDSRKQHISNTWNEMDHHNIIIIIIIYKRDETASNKTEAIMICSFGHFNMFKGVYLTVLDKGQWSEVILTHKTRSCLHKVQSNHYISVWLLQFCVTQQEQEARMTK